ncbi:MAG: site-specific integrase [Francisellaceae bacterium]
MSHFQQNDNKDNENIINDFNLGKNLENKSRAERTILRYHVAWKLFSRYCHSRGVSPLPAKSEVLFAFFSYMHQKSYKLNTITITKAAIEYYHEKNNHIAAVKHPRVLQLLDGIRRDLGYQTHSSLPLTVQQLKEICHSIKLQSLPDYRDKAMLLLGFFAGLRPSELITLERKHCQLSHKGLMLKLIKTKADQYAVGHTLAIPYNHKSPLFCPVTALQIWLHKAAIHDGFLFRGFYKGGHKFRQSHLSYQGFYRMFKQRASSVGIDVSKMTPHGLRSGFNTMASHAGASLHKMREITNQSLQTQQRYIKELDLFEDNAINQLFNQF